MSVFSAEAAAETPINAQKIQSQLFADDTGLDSFMLPEVGRTTMNMKSALSDEHPIQTLILSPPRR